MNGVIAVVVVMVIISAAVGLISQLLNKLNEAPPPRRPLPPRRGDGRPARSSPDRDMDRFLAEIDRLRKKNAEATAEPSAQSPPPPPAAPPIARPTAAPVVARPVAPNPRARPRPVAEPTEAPSRPRARVDGSGFATPHAAPPPATTTTQTAFQPTRVEDLPLATVVTPTSSTGAPATRVTRLPQRSRPVPKTELAKNLTGLLNSGQGIAMAVILQEILGPPKSRGGK